MDTNTILVIGGILFLVVAAVLLVLLKVKNFDVDSTPETELPTTFKHTMDSDSSHQLKVLVSASKTTGTFARDQVLRQAQRSSLLDLADLADFSKKIERAYSDITSAFERVDTLAMPIASGKAAKLKMEGLKLLQAVKERESEASALKDALKGSSDRIKELIKKPYVLRGDSNLELITMNKEAEVIQWTQLPSRVDHYCSEVHEVSQGMLRYAKSA